MRAIPTSRRPAVDGAFSPPPLSYSSLLPSGGSRTIPLGICFFPLCLLFLLLPFVSFLHGLQYKLGWCIWTCLNGSLYSAGSSIAIPVGLHSQLLGRHRPLLRVNGTCFNGSVYSAGSSIAIPVGLHSQLLGRHHYNRIFSSLMNGFLLHLQACWTQYRVEV